MEPGKSLKEQARGLRGGISQRYIEDRFSDVSRDAHASAQDDSHVATSDEPSAGFERPIVVGGSRDLLFWLELVPRGHNASCIQSLASGASLRLLSSSLPISLSPVNSEAKEANLSGQDDVSGR